jgi:hypothetical protein
MPDGASRLGVNVYCWGQTAQNLLLTECLAPAAQQLRDEFGFARFWFDRFDARGPHIIALFTLPRGAAPPATVRLASRLEGFFAAHPERGEVSDESVEKRHLSVRGAAYCKVDREPGIAEENSFRFFEPGPADYPLALTRGLPEAEAQAIWDLIDNLSLWAVRQIASDPEHGAVPVAVRWVASWEWTLRRMHPAAEEYWRFHAGSLLFGLPRRLEEDANQVLAALPEAIGERNARTFSRIWNEMEMAEPPWPRLGDLLRLLLAETNPPAVNPWRLPREIVHWTLKQLCLYVSAEIPLVLYAWRRNLS